MVLVSNDLERKYESPEIMEWLTNWWMYYFEGWADGLCLDGRGGDALLGHQAGVQNRNTGTYMPQSGGCRSKNSKE